MRNIFLEELSVKCYGEAPFMEKSQSETLLQKIKIECISGSTAWKVIQFAFIVYPSGSLPKYIKTKMPTTLLPFLRTLTKLKAFSGWEVQKQKIKSR